MTSKSSLEYTNAEIISYSNVAGVHPYSEES